MTTPETSRVPITAVDATASRALEAAHADIRAARVAARAAFDVDWVSRAANAFGARLDDVTALLDGVARLLDAAVVSARHAESVARAGASPQCVAGGVWGVSFRPGAGTS